MTDEPFFCEHAIDAAYQIIISWWNDDTQPHVLSIGQMRQALEAAIRKNWRPIEDAPRDGSRVILWKESTKEHYVAALVVGEYGPGWCTPDGFEIFRATHFMPIPPFGDV